MSFSIERKKGLSRFGRENLQDEPGTYCQTRQEEAIENHVVMSEGLKSELKESPTGQTQENLISVKEQL